MIFIQRSVCLVKSRPVTGVGHLGHVGASGNGGRLLELVLGLMGGRCGFFGFLLVLPVLAQMHVFLELHELLHLGLGLEGGDVLAEADLEVLEV